MKALQKTFLNLAVIAALSGLSSCTVKQEASKPLRSISVSGEGKVLVDNDTAEITFSVVTRNYDINKAVAENISKSTKVQEALAQTGILKGDIKTSNYTIVQDPSSSPVRINYGAYNVSDTITVKVRDVKRTGEIIDLCVKNGANQFSSLTFYASQTEKAKKEAEVLAIKNAESKAKSLASATGSKIGKVLTINTGYNYSVVKSSNAELLSASMPVNSGQSETLAEVTLTYELE
ncbi:SIMPL domain-containing protein [Treponema sp.]|uniref:SIMPL domain-containing protein n=1 Tax=Treponema sp. TaxID=166 RepID=UPI0025F2B9D5|nr:SIMPL domain-containing protein [Treponema sp.]MCR5217321.1 SIMPL domain-containing protein [Treponema sp.]